MQFVNATDADVCLSSAEPHIIDGSKVRILSLLNILSSFVMLGCQGNKIIRNVMAGILLDFVQMLGLRLNLLSVA